MKRSHIILASIFLFCSSFVQTCFEPHPCGFFAEPMIPLQNKTGMALIVKSVGLEDSVNFELQVDEVRNIGLNLHSDFTEYYLHNEKVSGTLRFDYDYDVEPNGEEPALIVLTKFVFDQSSLSEQCFMLDEFGIEHGPVRSLHEYLNCNDYEKFVVFVP